jgi:hypothetical protein
MLKIKIIGITLLVFTTAMLFTGCSFSADGHDFSLDVGDREKEYSSDEVVLNDVTATSTEIVDNVGSISVDYSSGNTVEIEVDCKVTGRNRDDLIEILDVVKVNAEVKSDTLQINVINKDTGENVWEWLEDEYHYSDKPDLDVDMDIKLPSSIQDFDVTSNVGDIHLNSLTGVFNVTGNVGSIDISDVNFTGDSDIRVDVGDISCSLYEESKGKADISLTANIGNIELDTNGLDYTTDRTGADDDNFVGTSKEVTVGDLYTFDTRIDVGKLDVR